MCYNPTIIPIHPNRKTNPCQNATRPPASKKLSISSTSTTSTSPSSANSPASPSPRSTTGAISSPIKIPILLDKKIFRSQPISHKTTIHPLSSPIQQSNPNNLLLQLRHQPTFRITIRKSRKTRTTSTNTKSHLPRPTPNALPKAGNTKNHSEAASPVSPTPIRLKKTTSPKTTSKTSKKFATF